MPIPMQLTAPNDQMGSNLLAGLTGDILKKVTKTIIDTHSEHAKEALGQGVPYGHILDQLIKMAPPGANLQGGGAPPPGGPGQDGGGPPPQGPQPMAKRQDAQMAPAEAQTQGVAPDMSQQQPQQGGGQQDILTALLASMQGGGGQQMQMPSFMGIKPSAQNQVLLTQAAQGQQQMAGRQPMQIGDIQKMIAGVGEKKLAAETVPPTQQETIQNQALANTAKLNAAQEQLKSYHEQMTELNAQEANAHAEAMASMKTMGVLSNTFGNKDILNTLNDKIKTIDLDRQKLMTKSKNASDSIKNVLNQQISSQSKGGFQTTPSGLKFRIKK